jgi:DeoR family transcriptional regulator of aga operon
MKVVVADHSKLGFVSKYLLCPTKGIDKLITDTGASASAIARFEKLGIEITLV